MPTFLASSTPVTAALDPVRGAVIGAGTLGVLLLIGLVIGLGLLFRRRSRTPGLRSAGTAAVGIEELSRRAGSLLVQVDDAVEDAENELGFALAQFGADQTRPFAEAVTAARAQVIEAFHLKQRLDDAYPESDQQRRDWTKRVIALSESAQTTITAQNKAFAALRRTEADSPARLAALREGLATSRGQIPASAQTLEQLAARYAPACVAEVAHNVEKAARILDEVQVKVDDAAARISETGVNLVSTAAGSVSAELDGAAQQVHTARQLLTAIDDTAAGLAAADAALAERVAATRADLVEARAQRDSAPDAETGAEINAAISGVEAALSAVGAYTGAPTAPGSVVLPTGTVAAPGRANPAAGLSRLGEAVSALDSALADARNQQQRLAHARTALVGALIGARSQISVTKAYMASNRTGVDARTRMAEAERQLVLAESESDPVAALDAARRSTTAAQDADALARYRG